MHSRPSEEKFPKQLTFIRIKHGSAAEPSRGIHLVFVLDPKPQKHVHSVRHDHNLAAPPIPSWFEKKTAIASAPGRLLDGLGKVSGEIGSGKWKCRSCAGRLG